MNKKQITQFIKQSVAMLLALVILVSFSFSQVVYTNAEAAEKYPYTIFTSSEDEEALTIIAENGSINGNIVSNGTINISKSMNLNGTKKENAEEFPFYIYNKLESVYFSDKDTQYIEQNLESTENIKLSKPLSVNGKITLKQNGDNGNLNLSDAMRSSDKITIQYDQLNANNSVLYSESGDIIIKSKNCNINGLLYAPNGQITIEAECINLNNCVIIADKLNINGKTVNISYGEKVAEQIGYTFELFDGINLFLFARYVDDHFEFDWFTEYEEVKEYKMYISTDKKNYEYFDSIKKDETTYKYYLEDGYKDAEQLYFIVSLKTKYGNEIKSLPVLMEKEGDVYILGWIDTDGDDIEDMYELMFGTDINNADTDGDGLSDSEELYTVDSDPVKYDSVTEGVSDSKADSDNDGLSNEKELKLETDPQKEDSDNDTLKDGEEVNHYNTNPLKEDTDEDELMDSDEIVLGTDPLKKDTDEDGVQDNEEYFKQEIKKERYGEELFEDNIAIPHIDYISAKGNVNNNIDVTEYNGYLRGEERFYIGKPVELSESDINGGKISFTLSEEYEIPEYETKLGKTNGLLICYNDGEEMTPLTTQCNEDERTLSADIIGAGIYFIIDVKEYYETFDFDFQDMCDVEEETDTAMAQSTLSETAMLANTTVANKKVKGQADIVFIVDTTGSMGTYINNVKRNIKAFVEDIKSADISPSFALVEYKDIKVDGSNSTKIISENGKTWFKNGSEFKKQIAKLGADGGGDVEESAIDALAKAEKIATRSSASNFFVLVTDAGYKTENNYNIKSMDEMIENLKKKDINVSVVTNLTLKPTYKNLYENTGGIFGNIQGDFKNVLLSVAANIKEETNSKYFVFLKALGAVKRAKLNEKPTKNSVCDTDQDSLADCKELESVNPIYTINLNPATKALYGVSQKVKDGIVNVYKCKSDPTRKDSDGDGLKDGSCTYKGNEAILPKDPEPLKYNGRRGMWKKYYTEQTNANIPTKYGNYDKGIGASLGKATKSADELVGLLLQCKNAIEKNERTLKKKAKEVKALAKSQTALGGYLLNFIRDENGVVYHSQVETWQKEFGYNKLYDKIFKIASDMKNLELPFEVKEGNKDKNYKLWLWKGDYWNMKSGAEMGLYEDSDIRISGVNHYYSVDFTLPMKLSLFNYNNEKDIETVFNWNPSEEQWWITGFNPKFNNPNPKKMITVSCIDFSKKTAFYESLVDQYKDKEQYENLFYYDKQSHKIWLLWNNEETIK